MAKLSDNLSLTLADNSRSDESFGRGGVSFGDGATVVHSTSRSTKWMLPLLYSVAVAFAFLWLREDIFGKIDLQTVHTDTRFDRMAERVETAKADILKNRDLAIENRNAIAKTTATLDALRTDCADLDRREKNSEGAWVWLFRRDILSAIDRHTERGKISTKDLEVLQDEITYYHEKLGGNHDVREKWERFKMAITAGKVKVVE